MDNLIKIKFLVIAGLVGALFLVGNASVAHAEEAPEGMTLSPTSNNYEVDPGEVVQGELTVLNDGQTPYDFRVYAAPYSVSGENYDPNFMDVTPTSDVFRWIQFEQVNWRAEVRETIKIPFTMRVSGTASPGGHYGVIFAETQPKDDRGSVVRKKRLGMVMYVNVRGDSKLEGKTQSIDIGWLQNRSPVKAEVRYSNTGNVHYMSKQEMIVTDILGRTVYRHTQDLAVLPDKPRQVDLRWSGASWLGLYRVTVASIATGDATSKESYVLVAPVWFLALVIASVGSGVAYAIYGRRKKRR